MKEYLEKTIKNQLARNMFRSFSYPHPQYTKEIERNSVDDRALLNLSQNS